MRILTPSLFFTALLTSSLLGLTACEPKGPASDIGDNIDQVKEQATTASSVPASSTAAQPASDVAPSSASESPADDALAPLASNDAATDDKLEQPLRPVREAQSEEQPDSRNIRPELDRSSNRTPAANDQTTPSDALAPAAEVIEQQKKQLAEANQAASAEADQKLNEILEEAISEP